MLKFLYRICCRSHKIESILILCFQVLWRQGRPEQVLGQPDRAHQQLWVERQSAQQEIPIAHSWWRKPGQFMSSKLRLGWLVVQYYQILGQWLCGSVGRAVASDIRGLRFESSHRHKFIYLYWTFAYCQLCIGKTKIKKKRPWMAHLKKSITVWPTSCWFFWIQLLCLRWISNIFYLFGWIQNSQTGGLVILPFTKWVFSGRVIASDIRVP